MRGALVLAYVNNSPSSSAWLRGEKTDSGTTTGIGNITNEVVRVQVRDGQKVLVNQKNRVIGRLSKDSDKDYHDGDTLRLTHVLDLHGNLRAVVQVLDPEGDSVTDSNPK